MCTHLPCVVDNVLCCDNFVLSLSLPLSLSPSLSLNLCLSLDLRLSLCFAVSSCFSFSVIVVKWVINMNNWLSLPLSLSLSLSVSVYDFMKGGEGREGRKRKGGNFWDMLLGVVRWMSKFLLSGQNIHVCVIVTWSGRPVCPFFFSYPGVATFFVRLIWDPPPQNEW